MNEDEKYIELLEVIMNSIAKTHDTTIPLSAEAAIMIIDFVEQNFVVK